jgi:NAD(P)-dependent dehydrogenase (short-subunit alcohol dehydrogenase family)
MTDVQSKLGWRGFPLSRDVVEEQGDIAILGRKGMGKTTASKAIVERLVAAGRRVVILDPVSHWWGLKLAADGAGKGLPVVVIGGDNADIDTPPEAGREVAELVLASPHSVVVDVGAMARADMLAFVGDFLERLAKKDSAPLWLVLEEADVFAPQRAQDDQKRVRSLVDHIVRRGRRTGFRLITITQRAAVIDKSVLSQLSTMVVFGLKGLQDRRAVRDWFEGSMENASEVFTTLPTLARGEAWAWLPDVERAVRISFPMITTFDSSRTPEAGAVRAPASVSADSIENLRAMLGQLVAGESARPLARKRKRESMSVSGRAVIAARTHAGLSQQQLGEAMGSNQAWVSKLEAGGNTRVSTLEKIGKVCGLALHIEYRKKGK